MTPEQIEIIGEHNDDISRMAEEIIELRITNEELQSEIDGLRNELKDKVEDMQNEIDELNDNLSEAEAELSDLRD